MLKGSKIFYDWLWLAHVKIQTGCFIQIYVEVFSKRSTAEEYQFIKYGFAKSANDVK